MVFLPRGGIHRIIISCARFDVEQNALVLIRPAVPGSSPLRCVGSLFLGGSFHQNQAQSTNFDAFVLGMDLFSKDVDEFLQAPLFHVGSDVVFHGSAGMGLVAHGIGKQKGLLVFYVFQERKGVGVFLLGFVAESGNEIGGNGHVRNNGSDGIDQFQVRLPSVSPFHAFEHFRATALGRHVQLRAHVGPLGHQLQEFHWIILRMGTGVSNAQLGGDVGDGFHQVYEPIPTNVGSPDPRPKSFVRQRQDVEFGALLQCQG
mmetsp:Transcript_23297/g.54924  ORF Transcript_23297/g.54924 Transcript_23297/m.54924 type:complete len:259 (-) Transcript_23297:519-1295(-)